MIFRPGAATNRLTAGQAGSGSFFPLQFFPMVTSPRLSLKNSVRKHVLSIHCLLALAVGWVSLAQAGELRIERTLLPDAAPSSFAVGFPSGVNFCYDVVRGGVSYIWQGGFVDVTSVRPNAASRSAR